MKYKSCILFEFCVGTLAVRVLPFPTRCQLFQQPDIFYPIKCALLIKLSQKIGGSECLICVLRTGTYPIFFSFKSASFTLVANRSVNLTLQVFILVYHGTKSCVVHYLNKIRQPPSHGHCRCGSVLVLNCEAFP